jgi:hypothetical protein
MRLTAQNILRGDGLRGDVVRQIERPPERDQCALPC